ncbi:MAG: TlpA family protein disulfide reductase [Rickettsiales bacterium]|nr:TlpA family protein disulfide reductase [Rickettsiales bacterium]
MFNQIRIAVFCIIIFYCQYVLGADKREINYPEVPTTSLYDLRGGEFTLERLDGNVLLIHFWATWCTSCVDGLKSLNKLQKLLRKDPIIIIPVSEDFKGVDAVKSFYNKFNLRFLPAFLDKNNRWFREMKVSALPTTFIVDSQGKTVMSMSGNVDWLDKKNIALIKKYISAKQPYNPDYVSLLNEHSVAVDKPKLPKQDQNNTNGEALLRSIETNLAPAIDEDKLKQGEIGMGNAPKNNFTDRRPVNLGYTNHKNE